MGPQTCRGAGGDVAGRGYLDERAGKPGTGRKGLKLRLLREYPSRRQTVPGGNSTVVLSRPSA
ncbi:hypothetical protein D3P05_19705 [Paracoccus siganidrum]|uniref:Uncharacterized protein n=1 Tax=Paracoccus siganidrum TaxID=1276757 RepID=A0A418ZY44_9RHOB|nr:hypothetical protein D3P05_19705 [Paracoccus siganidrum]